VRLDAVVDTEQLRREHVNAPLDVDHPYIERLQRIAEFRRREHTEPAELCRDGFSQLFCRRFFRRFVTHTGSSLYRVPPEASPGAAVGSADARRGRIGPVQLLTRVQG